MVILMRISRRLSICIRLNKQDGTPHIMCVVIYRDEKPCVLHREQSPETYPSSE
nr:MAG TPA: hypothetical protein [Caudoviricetes sp.]